MRIGRFLTLILAIGAMGFVVDCGLVPQLDTASYCGVGTIDRGDGTCVPKTKATTSADVNVDAGTPPDAGIDANVDAGSPDVDAGTNEMLDAGTPDVDAGTPDTTVADAGTDIIDAGTSSADAGTPVTVVTCGAGTMKQGDGCVLACFADGDGDDYPACDATEVAVNADGTCPVGTLPQRADGQCDANDANAAVYPGAPPPPTLCGTGTVDDGTGTCVPSVTVADAGTPPDAIDAGTPDVVDAGTPDVDAGSFVEADAGTDVDAGSPVIDADAGTPAPDVDAGSPDVDAGSPDTTDGGTTVVAPTTPCADGSTVCVKDADNNGKADTVCLAASLFGQGGVFQTASAGIVGYNAFDWEFTSQDVVSNAGGGWCVTFIGRVAGVTRFTMVSSLESDGVTSAVGQSLGDHTEWMQNFDFCTHQTSDARAFCHSEGGGNYLFAVSWDGSTLSSAGSGAP